jgi:hypothetical protein
MASSLSPLVFQLRRPRLAGADPPPGPMQASGSSQTPALDEQQASHVLRTSLAEIARRWHEAGPPPLGARESRESVTAEL